MPTLSIGLGLLLTLAVAAGCTPSNGPEQQPAAAREPSGGTAGAPLENTLWRLVSLGGQPARAGASGGPTLRLYADEKEAGGNTGCNSFSGPYELSGGSLSFGMLVSTRRACVEDQLNRQETAYLQALENTRSWEIRGDTLVLSGQAGPLARFAAQTGPAPAP